MKLLFSLLFLLSACRGLAQEKIYFGQNFAMNTKALNAAQHESYPSGPSYHNESKSGLYWTAVVLGTAGGALIGYPLGQALGGGQPQWALAGVGAGLCAIAITLDIIDKKRNYAFSVPDKRQKDFYTSSRRKQINITASGNTVGLSLRF